VASIKSSSSALSFPFAVIEIGEISALQACSSSEIRTYLALAVHADEAGDCWPGRRRLADITAQSREHVSRATSSLAAAGLIEKQVTPTGRLIYHLPLHHGTAASGTPQCQPWHPPVPTPAPVEQSIEPTKNQERAVEPEPAPPEPALAVSLSEEGLHKIKTSPPDGVPASWIDAGRLLRPDLSAEAVRQSGEVFLDHHRAKGTELADWLPAWRNWLRRERAPKAPPFAHKPLATPAAPSPYSSWTGGVAPYCRPVETAEQAAAKFEERMKRLGAVRAPDGGWLPPSSVPAAEVPPTPRAVALTQTLSPEEVRRIAVLAANGASLREVGTRARGG
jgi:hypothetical protein